MKTLDLSVQDVSPAEWKGGYCAEEKPSLRVIETAAGWQKLWKESLSGAAPQVNFGNYFAVAIFVGEQGTGGYGVEFGEPTANAGDAIIHYKIRSPRPDAFVTQAITRPYAVKLYKKTDLKIIVKEEH